MNREGVVLGAMGKVVKDSKGVEIREGCLVRTKAFDKQNYEYFQVIYDRRKLSVQRLDEWGNLRTYSVEYIRRWMNDDSLEVVAGPPSK